MATSGILLALLLQAVAADAAVVVEHARLRSASISENDYPRAARKRGEQGRVVVHYRVDPAGRPGECVVRESSGSALLDETTCGIILRTFRFAPARDADGEAVSEIWEQEIEWTLPKSIRLADPRPAAG